jgi:hypothetical protein
MLAAQPRHDRSDAGAKRGVLCLLRKCRQLRDKLLLNCVEAGGGAGTDKANRPSRHPAFCAEGQRHAGNLGCHARTLAFLMLFG